MQLLSALRQSEFCIARLVLKKVFDYSVVLCKILQRRSNLYEAVNTAEDIMSEMKSLRQNAECEFHELFVSAQETAQNQGFSLDMPRLTPRQINRCNVAAATNEEYLSGNFYPVFRQLHCKSRVEIYCPQIHYWWTAFQLIQQLDQPPNKSKALKFWESFIKRI